MRSGRIRQVLLSVLLVIFVGSALMLAGLVKQYLDAHAHNEKAQAYVHFTHETEQPQQEQAQEEEPPVPPQVDFSALQGINDDVCAWLWIPKTAISYPIMHASDNERYLNTAFDGAKSISGSVFMDFRNNDDFVDENTVLYGHNMKDHSLFGTLKKFRSQKYADEHQTIYVMTPKTTLLYRVFAVYDTQTADSCYSRNFESVEARSVEITRAIKRSTITAEVDPSAVERYLTLSTCTVSDAYRLVVQAYYEGEAS